MCERIFDGVIALLGLLVASLLFLLIAPIIELDSPGPIFYRTERIGQDGVPFRLYKFRSMVADVIRP